VANVKKHRVSIEGAVSVFLDASTLTSWDLDHSAGEDSMRRGLMKSRGDDPRPEYDLARLKGGVRGKYYQQATAGTNLG
jgi:hypothetical protein